MKWATIYFRLTRKNGDPNARRDFNLSIRKFLKIVGIGSQREIERATIKAIEDGTIKGTETFPATMTLEVAGLKLSVKFDGEIELE